MQRETHGFFRFRFAFFGLGLGLGLGFFQYQGLIQDRSIRKLEDIGRPQELKWVEEVGLEEVSMLRTVAAALGIGPEELEGFRQSPGEEEIDWKVESNFEPNFGISLKQMLKLMLNHVETLAWSQNISDVRLAGDVIPMPK